MFLLISSFRLFSLIMMSHLDHVTETGFARQATINSWMQVGSHVGGT